MGRCAAHLALACVAVSSLGVPARSQSAPQIEAHVAGILEKHCDVCRGPAGGPVVELATLAERDDLVRPGDPDASALYLRLLARHSMLSRQTMASPAATPASEGLSASDVEAVRAWIHSLEPDSNRSNCRDRQPITPATVAADALRWRKSLAAGATEEVRFISLAALYNQCRSDERLAAVREAVGVLLRRLAKPGNEPVLDTVGETSTLLAFRPKDLGLSTVAWDVLAARSEKDPGIALAEAVAGELTTTSDRDLYDPARAPTPTGAIDPVVALASEWTRPVTLQRAAAELGSESSALTARLAKPLPRGTEPEFETLALRLSHQGLARDEWLALASLLEGARVALPREAASPGGTALNLDLWVNRLRYRTGDHLTIHARPSHACFLTVVVVEPDGIATVLFPSDFQMDNAVAAGTTLNVPGRDHGYRLVLDDPGQHRIHAICNTRTKRPEGVGHDLERQRFTLLGDWVQFLSSTREREALYKVEQEESRRFRERRRRGRDGAAGSSIETASLGDAAEDEARAGLTLTVEPWPPEAGVATGQRPFPTAQAP